ncbi:MAG: GAF domain-containing protein [Chloroflexota bacterium]
MSDDTQLQAELDAARATIATQATRLHALEAAGDTSRRVADTLALNEVLAETVGKAPYQALLQAIVHAARRLFDAGAASIALLDTESQELVFEAAIGEGSSDVLGRRFPAHQGIAGWVVMTGEPIAVSDVRRDPRFSQGFAQSTGYVPQSIMAAPLLMGEEVGGVIEVLDKSSQGSFGLGDLELLGLFAQPAALGVEQARLVGGVGQLLVAELAGTGDERGTDPARGTTSAPAAMEPVEGETLELARLVHEIARQGDRSRRLALEILQAIKRGGR